MTSKSILEILYELAAIQSDTGTPQEVSAANKIFRLIRQDSYFQEHPDHCGIYGMDLDILGRPVVWALRKGQTDKTILLTGHYDAVEIESYGELAPYALYPAELKDKLKEAAVTSEAIRRDLADNNWMFGRGVADMKAGIAINLYTLLNTVNEEINILFTAVFDAENISAGARISMPFYRQLQARFVLDYKLAIISEPQFSTSDQDRCAFHLYQGGAGKLLPIIVAKGLTAHSSNVLEELSGASMIAEITRNIDLNEALITEDLGMSTQPPITQVMINLKNTYDASIPEYAAACVNILFLGNRNPSHLIDTIIERCKKSMSDLMLRYHKAFDLAEKSSLAANDARISVTPEVLELKELTARVRAARPDFDTWKQQQENDIAERINSGEMNHQMAGIQYVEALLKFSGIDMPLVVVGIVPPYYPAVSTTYLDKDSTPYIENAQTLLSEKYGLYADAPSFMLGMADISYMSCLDPKAERELMQSMAIPTSIYDIPFEDIVELNLPTLLIGPRCHDCHQWSERVFVPDVETIVPDIFQAIIASL